MPAPKISALAATSAKKSKEKTTPRVRLLCDGSLLPACSPRAKKEKGQRRTSRRGIAILLNDDFARGEEGSQPTALLGAFHAPVGRKGTGRRAELGDVEALQERDDARECHELRAEAQQHHGIGDLLGVLRPRVPM